MPLSPRQVGQLKRHSQWVCDSAGAVDRALAAAESLSVARMTANRTGFLQFTLHAPRKTGVSREDRKALCNAYLQAGWASVELTVHPVAYSLDPAAKSLPLVQFKLYFSKQVAVPERQGLYTDLVD